MPKQQKAADKPVDIEYLLGVVTKWLVDNDREAPKEAVKASEIKLAYQLQDYLKERSFNNENNLVEAIGHCHPQINPTLSDVMTTLSGHFKGFRLKKELELKLVEYRQKERSPSFFGRGEDTYKAKREVMQAVKLYLYNRVSLVRLNEIMTKYEGAYNAGWTSTIDDLIGKIKLLKRESLLIMSNALMGCNSIDRGILEEIRSFARGEAPLVKVMGKYEMHKVDAISHRVRWLYQQALDIDEAISPSEDKTYGEGRLCLV